MGKVFRRLQDRRAGRGGQPVGVHTLAVSTISYIVELQAFLEQTVPAEHRDKLQAVMDEARNLEEAYRNFLGRR